MNKTAREKQRANARSLQRRLLKCSNCGESIEHGGHFVPPSLGEKGFYICALFRETAKEKM